MKMRKLKKGIIIMACCLLVVAMGGIAWMNSVSFRPESPILVEYSSCPSYGCYTDFYSTHIRIYNDGTVDVYGSFVEDGYIEGGTFQISEEQLEEVRKTVDRHPFLWNKEILPDYGTCDGSYCTLTIYDGDGEVYAEVSGYSPMDPSFCSVSRAVGNVLPDGYWSEVNIKIHDYVLENFGEE